ncbi:MAG: D-2-hydroxyacid dehydrogenase [Clostridia bacterium]|nr:D-2-hydroxyacid dehydrogenase [Clostridia bacterium]
MKIVVLDGYALNPGDNPWGAVSSLGEFICYDRTSPEDTLSRSLGADILLTNKTVLSRDILSKLPDLKYIGVLATGYNIVDVKAAAELGIPVCNVPAYSTDSVSQLVMAHILEHCHQIRRHSDEVLAGAWCACPDYSFWSSPLVELAGKTLGIVGFGAIGRKTALLGSAFGMKILACSPRHIDPPSYPDFVWAGLEELFEKADFISLHCPLTPDNTGMINAANISLMKPTAFLINTARGGLINETDLAGALNSGKIAGAALDVLSTEPPSPDNPLLKAKNVTISPHIAWATLEARRRLMAVAAENIVAFLNGKTQNLVNGGNKK